MNETRVGQHGARRARPYLPSAQLADAVMRLAKRSTLAAVCERAGIPERVVMRWRLGESSGLVDLALADQVMARLDLFWWDVWNETTLREPLFTVTTHVNAMKKDRHGVYRRRRMMVRTIPYGDLGTDFWRLRQVELSMRGRSLAEVA